MRSRLAVALVVASVTAAAAAVEVMLDARAVGEAIAIGQSRIERERVRFHEPYRLKVNRPPVDYVDVVTPFRRIVLTAESRAQIGDRTFGQRQAFDILDAAPAAIELWIEFTFHPLNTYVGVPGYAIWLARAGTRVPPRSFEQHPRYGPRVAGMPLPLPIPTGPPLPGASQPLAGGTVVARFDARPLDPAGVYEVVVEEMGKELARVRVDLSRLR